MKIYPFYYYTIPLIKNKIKFNYNINLFIGVSRKKQHFDTKNKNDED